MPAFPERDISALAAGGEKAHGGSGAASSSSANNNNSNTSGKDSERQLGSVSPSSSAGSSVGSGPKTANLLDIQDIPAPKPSASTTTSTKAPSSSGVLKELDDLFGE